MKNRTIFTLGVVMGGLLTIGCLSQLKKGGKVNVEGHSFSTTRVNEENEPDHGLSIEELEQELEKISQRIETLSV